MPEIRDAGQTDIERDHLRRLGAGAGLDRDALSLRDRIIQLRGDARVRASVDHPLLNRDVIADRWHSVGVMEQFCGILLDMIEAEVSTLESAEQRAKRKAVNQARQQ